MLLSFKRKYNKAFSSHTTLQILLFQLSISVSLITFLSSCRLFHLHNLCHHNDSDNDTTSSHLFVSSFSFRSSALLSLTSLSKRYNNNLLSSMNIQLSKTSNEELDDEEEDEIMFVFNDDDDDDDDNAEDEDDIQSLWLLGDDNDDDYDEEVKEEGGEDNDDDDDEIETNFDSESMKKTETKSTQIDNNKDINIQSNNKKRDKEQDQSESLLLSTNIKLQNIELPSRGVGRQGYNITILHQVNYDQTLYTEQYIKESYNLRIALLQDYRDVHGDINIPFRYNVTVDDYDAKGNVSGSYQIHLGRWLHRIRTLYRKDKIKELDCIKKQGKGSNSNSQSSSKSAIIKRKIPLQYVEILDSMNMNWDGVGARRRPADFRKKCQELQAFIDKYGHSYVPKDWSKNKSLAMWVERQRLLYRCKIEGRATGFQLTDDRINTLQSMGFDFVGSITKKTNNLGSGSINEIDQMSIEDNYNSQSLQSDIHTNTQNQMEIRWWRTLRNLRQFNDDEKSLTEADISYLSYWVMEQRRQNLILQNELETIRPRNAVTPKIHFKCQLTPKRYESLVDSGFDFSMRDCSWTTLFDVLPWKDFADFDFEYHKMLDLMSVRKDTVGNCNVILDQNLITKLFLFNHDNSDVNVDDLILLYLFQQRMRWENKHQSIRSKITEIDWILEKEELDVENELNKLGFVWFEHNIPEYDEIWFREYEWWGHFYDLCRYKKANGDFALDPKGLWYSEDLVDWLEEQTQDYDCFIKVSDGKEDGRSDTQPQRHFEEWHLQAMHDLGFEFKSSEDSLFIQSASLNGFTSVGRPPAILTLENNMKNQYDSLSSDLKQVMISSNNRKPVDKAEQLAWLVRYEALRRLYLIHGSGSISTLSTDKDVGDQRLALWAINQRKQYKNYLEGKKSALTPYRIFLLDKIKFDWEIKSEEDTWEEMIDALKKFKNEHGNCFVPASYSRDIKLGQWVHLQRQVYQMSKREDIIDLSLPSTLTTTRVKELIDVGLDITMDNLSFANIAFETVWKCRLEDLKQFKSQHGHCNVPLDYTNNYYDLALWVNEQRILYQLALQGISSQLDTKKIEKLQRIGFSWQDESCEACEVQEK